MGRTLVVLVLLIAGGCLENGLVPCGDKLCPAGQVPRPVARAPKRIRARVPIELQHAVVKTGGSAVKRRRGELGAGRARILREPRGAALRANCQVAGAMPSS